MTEGLTEEEHAFLLSRAAYGRIAGLLRASALQYERLRLPKPEVGHGVAAGRTDLRSLASTPPAAPSQENP